MINIVKKEDLRIKKTYRALYDAMFTMLNYKNFNDVTVNDLCAEALISRTTFYAHFRDKYNLLNYFLLEIQKDIIKDVHNYEELEKDMNHFVRTNKKLITNILKDANSETLALMREFMASIVEFITKRKMSDEISPNHTILFNFFAGGLVNLLTWMVENNFPEGINMMNSHLYKMLEATTTWDAEQEQEENIDRTQQRMEMQ